MLMNHSLRMLLGCLLPLGLIFVLPLFGVGSGVTLLVFVVLMFGCHLMMLGPGSGHGHGKGHGHGGHDGHDHQQDTEKGVRR
jgi:hypothetical protein